MSLTAAFSKVVFSTFHTKNGDQIRSIGPLVGLADLESTRSMIDRVWPGICVS